MRTNKRRRLPRPATVIVSAVILEILVLVLVEVSPKSNSGKRSSDSSSSLSLSLLSFRQTKREQEEVSKTDDSGSSARKIVGTKLISFSLYGGDNPRYIDGAFANADLLLQVYPEDWIMRIYHDDSISPSIVQRLRRKPRVELVDMTLSPLTNEMTWRFLPASQADQGVERFCSRDIDSRFTPREAAAVQEWVDSGMKFHIMRDHPSHSAYTMSGGMWCATSSAFPQMEHVLEERQIARGYVQDMNFLDEVVWPVARQSRSLMQHDSFSCKSWEFGGDGRPFPFPRQGDEHIGGVYLNGKLRRGDVEILRRAREPWECRPAFPQKK